MPEQDNNNGNRPNEIDLSELSNLQFATAWTPSNSQSAKPFVARKGDSSFKGGKRDSSDKPKRERSDFKKRPQKFQKKQDGEQSEQPRQFKKRGKSFDKKFDKKFKKETFVPTMEVLFYPEDAPFNKLADIIKASKRTYQLFDIAQIILEKPERYVVLAKNLSSDAEPAKPLYCAQPMNIPFEDEQSAKNAAINYRIEELFERTEIEAEPPKGTFQVVNKCSITGDLLGAPNWHKYNETLREYHSQKFANMPFEKFVASIETVREKEQIDAWLEQMKTRTVYKLKTQDESAPEYFETRDAVCAYISEKFGADLVKTYEQVRMRGENIKLLPFGRIRKNIEEAWRKQKKFPIVTANNLRGRLRRSGFTVYKRGSKGFAFVSVIKRKFIYEGDALSDVPQRIFDYIAENPAVLSAELPYKFLGMTPPKSEKAKTLAEEHSEGVEALEAQKLESAELSDEEKVKLSNVWSELAWLISEGYVVEYADGTLQANPRLPKPKNKDSAQSPEETVDVADDEPIVAEATPVEESSDEEKESAECSDSVENNAE